jgi:hypothetical protein
MHLRHDLTEEDLKTFLSPNLSESDLLLGIEFVETWLSVSAIPRLRELAERHPSQRVREAALAAAKYLQP